MRALICFAIFTSLSLLWLSISKNDARAIGLTEAPDSQIACVSYAPYRKPGETPFDPTHRVSEERIRDDLNRLKSLTGCVRTYSSQSGLESVPKIASELGLKVLLGIWIGRNEASNRLEINAGIDLANRYPDTVRGLIVGNEVLLRREQTREGMAAYLQEVQNSVDIPVTYADVWEFWMKNKPLAESVDYLTIHILPYWEDEPVGIDQAVNHVASIFEHVQAEFAGREMMIGETGWPSAGRQRGPATPGKRAQAEFIRAWVATATDKQIDYNLIEAFDQPWKRALEGAMGGHWGMLDSAGETKFAWQGPVAENPAALRHALLGGGLMLIVFVTTCAALQRIDHNFPAGNAGNAGRKPWSGPARFALAASAGFASGAVLPAQLAYLTDWNRYPSEWIASSGFVLAGWLLALLLPFVAGSGRELLSATQAWQQMRAVTRPGAGQRIMFAGSWLRLALLAGCALFMMLHAFDARYRGFALPLYVIPTAIMLTLWVSGQLPGRQAIQERWVSLVALICLPFMLWPELPENRQAISLALLVLPIAIYGLLGRRSNRMDASNTAAAPGSTE